MKPRACDHLFLFDKLETSIAINSCRQAHLLQPVATILECALSRHIETAVTHLCMFYLKLCHLDEVLPEGHNSPAFKNGELCFEGRRQSPVENVRLAGRFGKGSNNPLSFISQHAHLSSQTRRACQISAGTAAGAPQPVGCPCSSVAPYPKLC